VSTERIGKGPWARWVATAIVPDEGSSTAHRGAALARAREVYDVVVDEGEIRARVGDERVTLSARPVPERIWAAMVRSARTNPPLKPAVEGRSQSIQLEHLMTLDWDEPLIPKTASIARECTCTHLHAEEGAKVCEHIAAVAYAVAEQIDRDPAVLLRWRGCLRSYERPAVPVETAVGETPAAAWEARELAPARPLRRLPAGAVLKRLGPSGVRAGSDDLADVLERAYRAFTDRG
jgi:uncharacterized Zn finger protein